MAKPDASPGRKRFVTVWPPAPVSEIAPLEFDTRGECRRPRESEATIKAFTHGTVTVDSSGIRISGQESLRTWVQVVIYGGTLTLCPTLPYLTPFLINLGILWYPVFFYVVDRVLGSPMNVQIPWYSVREVNVDSRSRRWCLLYKTPSNYGNHISIVTFRVPVDVWREALAWLNGNVSDRVYEEPTRLPAARIAWLIGHIVIWCVFLLILLFGAFGRF